MTPTDAPSGLARVRGAERGPAGDAQPPVHPRGGRSLPAAWALLTLLSAGALVVLLLRPADDLGLPSDVPWTPGAAALLTTLLHAALAWRVGGRTVAVTVVAAALAAGAVASGWTPLLAGAALGAAVGGAALGVVLTVPARSVVVAAREVVLALLVALLGALAAGGYGADVDDARFGYATLGLTMLLLIGVVHRLGGGVHALGRVGSLLVVGAVVLLALALAYAWAIDRWASPSLVDDLAAARDRAVDLVGAVPAALPVLVGVPALLVGVTARHRRRQGWWVCVFGAAATAPVAAAVANGADLLELLLATAYAALAGSVLGLLAVGVLRLLGRLRGGEPRREPPRSSALY